MSIEKLIASQNYLHDPDSRELIEYLDENLSTDLNDAVLYYDFPIFQDYEDEVHKLKILILSKKKGLIIVNHSTQEIKNKISKYIQDQEEQIEHFYGMLQARLIQSKQLRIKRKLKVEISSIISNTSIDIDELDKECDSEICDNLDCIAKCIKEYELENELSEEDFNEARSIIEGAKALNKAKITRNYEDNESSKSYVLSKLEQEISNFDRNQRKTAITILEGPQRIRGLAGSGKTVVLAMKAAQLHLSDPSLTILFTFYTKSLITFIKDSITKFYRHYKSKDPDWEKIHVLHAWGGRWIEGVYYNACNENDFDALTYKDAKAKSNNPFSYACNELISSCNIKQKYDYILIDEAQDFPQSFFQLSYYLANGEQDYKSIVWAYDELQNIFKVKRLYARDFFGFDENGDDLINLDRSAQALKLPEYLSNDIVLHKCYRNPRKVLLVSHALGFGIYGDPVQTLEDGDHWRDLGYEVIQGDFRIGQQVIVERPESNSPLSISKYESEDEIIKTYKADSLDDEINFCISEIEYFLSEGVRPEDITVITLDDSNAKVYAQELTNNLFQKGISTNNLLANPFASVSFTIKDHVTLSTVYRAKGNECPVVFAVGIDGIYPHRESRNGRNRLFTAFTRAKAWLRISGIGKNAQYFFDEINQACSNYPRLVFNQPDPQYVEMIQRDLTMRSQRAQDILQKLKAEGVSTDDLKRVLDIGDK